MKHTKNMLNYTNRWEKQNDIETHENEPQNTLVISITNKDKMG